MNQPGERDLLIHRARDVRKVLNKTELNNGRQADRAFWQKLLERAKMSDPQAATPIARVQYELPARFEPEEMRSLQARWDAESAEMEEWDDVGFVLKGESTPYWLSKSVARGALELDVERDNLEVVNSQSLLSELRRNRTAITALIHQQNSGLS
jgi:hypothetical protein